MKISEDLIRYDVLIEEALRGVVRTVLQETATTGLPGEHYFYITFKTNAPGVRLSARTRRRHPKSLTIVLQHQFWELSAGEHAFEVGLSFGGIPEKIRVPYKAIRAFLDPSVRFSLEFEGNEEEEEELLLLQDSGGVSEASLREENAREEGESESVTTQFQKGVAEEEIPSEIPEEEPESASPLPKASEEEAAISKKSARVVSLDAFRKKP